MVRHAAAMERGHLLTIFFLAGYSAKLNIGAKLLLAGITARLTLYIFCCILAAKQLGGLSIYPLLIFYLISVIFA